MNKYFTHRHKIAHLSSSEQNELVDKYYSGENVKKLISLYNIDIRESSFYLVLPLRKDSNATCPYCKSAMFKILPPKNKMQAEEYICGNCWHTKGDPNCACRNCMLKKRDKDHNMEIKKAIRKISKNADYNIAIDASRTVRLEDISITDKIYLGALLRTHIPSKNCLVSVHTMFLNHLAPSVPFKNKIFDRLLKNNIIVEVSSSSNVIEFTINILDICINEDQLINLIYPEKLKEISPEIIELIRDIQIYEAVEYFSIIGKNEFSIQNTNQTSVGKSFYSLFLLILGNNYSIAQLYNFIYSGMRNYAAKHNCSSPYTDPFPEIYNNILRQYNTATAEGWTVKSYNRAYLGRPSELFKIVANNLLDIEDELFYKPIARESI